MKNQNATAWASTSPAACLTWRSEAFAEDLQDAAAAAAQPHTHDRSAPLAHWSLTLVPLLVALVGMAFAVVPPLA